MTGRFSEVARANRLRRDRAARTEEQDVEREQQEEPADYDGPWDAAELMDVQYGPEGSR